MTPPPATITPLPRPLTAQGLGYPFPAEPGAHRQETDDRRTLLSPREANARKGLQAREHQSTTRRAGQE